MLAVYTLSSKKRNVLVYSNKSEYNLQSRDKSKAFLNCVEKRKHLKCLATADVKESDNIIISLSNIYCIGKIVVGEVAVGEIKNFTAWGNWCWGSSCWEN